MSKKNLTQEIQDERVYGPEPDLSDVDIADSDYEAKYLQALNWANAILSYDQLKQETIKFLKNKNRETSLYENGESFRFSLVGKQCWLANRGCPFKKQSEEFLNKNLKKLEKQLLIDLQSNENLVLDAGKVRKKKQVTKKSDIREFKTNLLVEDVRGQISDLADLLILKNKSLIKQTAFDILSTNQVSQKIAKQIQQQYQNKITDLINERNNVRRDIDDFDSKEQLKTYINDLSRQIKAFQNIYNQIDSYVGNSAANKTKRKRKKKAKSAEKQIESLSYKSADKKYMIKSIDPERIVGSTMLVVFNTKNRKLGIYYANDDKGLSIKGTTIQNYNASKSQQKTIKKPERFLSHFQKSNDRRIRLVFDRDFNTKASELNGRINQHTILLKAFTSLERL